MNFLKSTAKLSLFDTTPRSDIFNRFFEDRALHAVVLGEHIKAVIVDTSILAFCVSPGSYSFTRRVSEHLIFVGENCPSAFLVQCDLDDLDDEWTKAVTSARQERDAYGERNN